MKAEKHTATLVRILGVRAIQYSDANVLAALLAVQDELRELRRFMAQRTRAKRKQRR